jgi:hypothetical protein
MDLPQLVQQYGPLIAACIFFVWRDWKREERLTSRIEKLEDEQRQVILPLVEKATAVIAHNTAVIEQLQLAKHEP